MNSEIKKFLENHKEFENIKENIFDEIEKKWYCIVQLLTNEEIAANLSNKKNIDDYQLERYMEYQENSSLIFFENSIFYNFKFYKNFNIFEKKWIQNTAIVQTLFKSKSYWDIYKNTQNYINIIKYSINNFFQTYKRNLGVIIYISIFILLILWRPFLLEFDTSDRTIIEKKRSVYILSWTFVVSIFILLLSFLLRISYDILKVKKYNFIIRQIEKYNILDSGFNIFKRLDDNIFSLKSLGISKDILEQFEENPASLKQNQKILEDSAQILVQITNDINLIYQKNKNISLQKTLWYSINSFLILIKNWIKMLTDIQNQISDLNKNTVSSDQKTFVKTTDKLNIDIWETIKQLEILKI